MARVAAVRIYDGNQYRDAEPHVAAARSLSGDAGAGVFASGLRSIYVFGVQRRHDRAIPWAFAGFARMRYGNSDSCKLRAVGCVWTARTLERYLIQLCDRDRRQWVCFEHIESKSLNATNDVNFLREVHAQLVFICLRIE